jgi:predicted RNase H-like HicB family nuclease
MVRTFTLEYWQDDGWYVGRLKEVPGVFSQGETMAELEDNIRDAYKMMMETEVLPELSMRPKEKEVDITL